MGHQTSIGKTSCPFCKKVISRNGLGYTSHLRKHVREGIAIEIGPNHHKYRGCLEFLNLQRHAKVGTMPANIILDKWSYAPKIGRKIKFRYHDDNKWMAGLVDDINENYIFIGLI